MLFEKAFSFPFACFGILLVQERVMAILNMLRCFNGKRYHGVTLPPFQTNEKLAMSEGQKNLGICIR